MYVLADLIRNENIGRRTPGGPGERTVLDRR